MISFWKIQNSKISILQNIDFKIKVQFMKMLKKLMHVHFEHEVLLILSIIGIIKNDLNRVTLFSFICYAFEKYI